MFTERRQYVLKRRSRNAVQQVQRRTEIDLEKSFGWPQTIVGCRESPSLVESCSMWNTGQIHCIRCNLRQNLPMHPDRDLRKREKTIDWFKTAFGISIAEAWRRIITPS